MIILDAPYASGPLVQWLAQSQHPVLANDFSRALSADADAPLNLVGDAEAVRRLDAGERVYTNSENALAWILEHCSNATLTGAIRLFKDKAALREKLAPLNPGLFFATLDRRELEAVNVDDLPLPVVLKPAVGFCSMGVYVIEERDDWADAVADIARHEDEWHARYPDSVVGADAYLVEGYLEGTEYALDAYFDEDGRAHVLNVLRHDFAGPEDTSDRMYLTDAAIVAEMAPRLTAWLDQVNDLVGARSIPVHVELRVDGDAIAPIEFNPLRFAGLGGTDVAYYGVGLRTYQAFLEDEPVDLAALYGARPHDVFSMSLLNPAPDADLTRPFDYDALAARFTDVLALVPFDADAVGSYGFLFLRTDDATAAERDWLLHADLEAFAGEGEAR
ncbi:ATP-grasp domain-containing protein [Adlercreutzia faecimuris]|uniref:ATP-grasp domain-containing protein n=1 Tax=Adlercreutzia faecimuris TaxID=2897341 RepID=A0ABS9WJY6_9ACTN|nr:ATP-grasp domain-containing protein [Adlercreutzia sp. JBNU-10]MCI2242867.1 ATP-grasp domain-containing protein [Adlercreutzia sp. JBNU-10]